MDMQSYKVRINHIRQKGAVGQIDDIIGEGLNEAKVHT